jgi:exonuclease III
MKIVAWNCRRLGNGMAVCGLLNVQKEEDPDIMFLLETKMTGSRMDGFRWKLGLTNMVAKDCSGTHGGGLAMFWRWGIDLHVRGISHLYIDANVTEDDGCVWKLTRFYGEPEDKSLSWRALRVLNTARQRPWICLGDFNEILLVCEKEGGQPRQQGCMDQFREALEECELADLGFVGDPFTWRNNTHTSKLYIKERLDRAVANKDWTLKFSLYHIINGEPRHSDHRPVIVDSNPPRSMGGGRGQHAFRLRQGGWKRRNVPL